MDIITVSRKCDTCGRVLAPNEGKRLPAVPFVDVCSQDCAQAHVTNIAADLPKTSADAAALAVTVAAAIAAEKEEKEAR